MMALDRLATVELETLPMVLPRERGGANGLDLKAVSLAIMVTMCSFVHCMMYGGSDSRYIYIEGGQKGKEAGLDQILIDSDFIYLSQF